MPYPIKITGKLPKKVIITIVKKYNPKLIDVIFLFNGGKKIKGIISVNSESNEIRNQTMPKSFAMNKISSTYGTGARLSINTQEIIIRANGISSIITRIRCLLFLYKSNKKVANTNAVTADASGCKTSINDVERTMI